MEIWKPIPGLEPYEISSLGRIGNAKRDTIRKPRIDKKGYAKFQYEIDGKHKSYFVHRLVLLAFIGPCPEGMEVNHKNAIRDDNRLENLEYVTRSQNQLHRSRIMHHFNGADTPNAKFTDDDIYQMRLLYMDGMRTAEIAAEFGTTPMNAWKIISGQTWYHVPMPEGFVLREDRGLSKQTTAEQDEEMIALYQTGDYSLHELAGMFGLSKNAISKRVAGKTEKQRGWKLTRSQQEELVRLYKTGEYSQRELGERFSTSVGNVNKLIKRLG